MPTFHYEAKENRGDEVSGTLTAADQKAASEEVRAMGYFVLRLEQVCPHCGGPVREFVDCCENCGKRLTGREQEPQPESRDKAIDQADSEVLERKVLELLRAGMKVDAVKVYRQASGLGLGECKAYVESLARSHGLPDTAAAGWVPAVALLLGVMAATVFFLLVMAAPLLVMRPLVGITALGFLGGLVLLGLFLLALAGLSALEHRRHGSWPTTPGIVTFSQVVTREGVNREGECWERFLASVQYAYSVAGQEYVGQAVRRFWNASQDEFETDYGAQRVVNRYPVGTSVTVYYNPETPEEAILERGLWWGTLTVVLPAIVAVGLGVYLWVTFR